MPSPSMQLKYRFAKGDGGITMLDAREGGHSQARQGPPFAPWDLFELDINPLFAIVDTGRKLRCIMDSESPKRDEEYKEKFHCTELTADRLRTVHIIYNAWMKASPPAGWLECRGDTAYESDSGEKTDYESESRRSKRK